MPATTTARAATWGLLWVVAVFAPATVGRAADPLPAKTGGLVPGAAAPRTGLTREELIREWDLDGDGTISKPESDVARGRMKRRRLEMQLGAGVDPITGLPRSLDEAEGEGDADENGEPVFRLPPEPPPQPQQPQESLPGMRSPKLDVPRAGMGTTLPAAPTPATAPALPGKSVGPEPPARSGRASWLPPQRLSPAMTGGVRAGAPAAAPGYGSGPWSDLNAGRRPAGQQPAFGTTLQGRTGAAGTGSGGLLPAARLPGRTGSLVIPSLPGQTQGLGPPPRAAAPPPPLVPQPRITADEIGGYRP